MKLPWTGALTSWAQEHLSSPLQKSRQASFLLPALFQLFGLQVEFKLKTLLRPAHSLTATTKPLHITLETESMNKEDLIIQD